jgi:hypothetical protein
VLRSERAVDKISKSFLEQSKLPAYLIKLATNMVMRVKDLVDLQYSEKMNEFKKVLIPLEKIAGQKGVKAFDLIAKKTKTGMTLIKKLDSAFIDKVKVAKEKKDKKFLTDAMDMKKYKEMLDQTLKENIAKIEARDWYPLDESANKAKKEYEIRRLRNRVDINRQGFTGYESTHFSYLFYNSLQEEKFYSKEFKDMKATPEAFKAWEFFTELNKTAKGLGYLDSGGSSLSFFPLIEATTIEKLAQSKNPLHQAWDSIKDLYSVKIDERQNYASMDEETGQIKRSIPKYFTATDKQVEQLSTNLDMIGGLWIKSILDYKASRQLEYRLLTLYDVEKAKDNLAVSNGELIYDDKDFKKVEGENQNATYFRKIIDDSVYFIKEDLDSWGAQKISAITNIGKPGKEKREKRAVNVKKTIKTADVIFRALAIGLKPAIGLANYFGLQMQAFINAGEFYRFREFTKMNTLIKANAFSTNQKALLHYIMPLNEDMVAEKRREIAKTKGSLMKWLSTWTFTDIMMSTNAFPERLLQYSNAVAMINNSMVLDGKIVNIRQHLKEQDRQTKYKMSESARKALEKSFEERVKKMKESKGLDKVVKIDADGKISIPGVALQEVADFRIMIREYGRKLSGLMSENNKMGYRRDTILSSFMMFRSWMPKHLSTRVLDISKNVELNQWEYGKSRLFVKVLLSLSNRNIMTFSDIISGNEKGLAFMKKMLEEKKVSYFNATGKQLTISEEEFYDLVRTELRNSMKEILLLVSVTAAYFTMAAAEPPEDLDDSELNMYKYFAKVFNKTADEIMFYYNPVAFDSFTRGSILPSLGLLTKAARAFDQLRKETYGYYLDDEDIMDGAHPLKYFLNLVPGASQFQNELLPILYPEMAKDLGIRVNSSPMHR